ncbi:hypothetical protein IAR50_003701 [Cryptococcus sp. DSM 104548]
MLGQAHTTRPPSPSPLVSLSPVPSPGLLQRLQPVHYIIFEYLFRLSPILVLQLSKAHCQRYLPQLYRRVTITRKRVNRWWTDSVQADCRRCRPAMSTLDNIQRYTKTLRLCNITGVQQLSAYLLNHGEIFSRVGCLQISPRLFPKGRNADGILDCIREIVNCPHITVNNIAILLDPENHSSLKTCLASTCIAEIVTAGNLPIDTLTIHIPKIPVWKPSITRDYVIDIGYLGLVWGSRNRLRLVFDLNERAYPTGNNVGSFTSAMRYLAISLIPMLALPRYHHFKVEIMINDEGRVADGGGERKWLVPETTWKAMLQNGPSTTKYTAAKMFWENNTKIARISGKETREALEMPC